MPKMPLREQRGKYRPLPLTVSRLLPLRITFSTSRSSSPSSSLSKSLSKSLPCRHYNRLRLRHHHRRRRHYRSVLMLSWSLYTSSPLLFWSWPGDTINYSAMNNTGNLTLTGPVSLFCPTLEWWNMSSHQWKLKNNDEVIVYWRLNNCN